MDIDIYGDRILVVTITLCVYLGGDEELTARLQAVVQVRNAHTKETGRHVPVLVKLGDLKEVGHTLALLEKAGVDGLVGLNTQKDYADYEPHFTANDKVGGDDYSTRSLFMSYPGLRFCAGSF
jgi:dihydroorotate dehydrogenase